MTRTDVTTSSAEDETSRAMSPDDTRLDYESFNIFALAGALLGVCSIAALADRAFWLIPIVGVAMSLYGLWAAGRSESSRAGRSLAIVGLCLSMFFLSAAPTIQLARRWYLRCEARVVADRWFECLRHGDAVAAYHLSRSRTAETGTFDRRKYTPTEVNYYVDSDDVVRRLLKHRDDASATFSKTIMHAERQDADEIYQRYLVRWSQETKPQPVDIVLEYERDPLTRRGHWRVRPYATH